MANENKIKRINFNPIGGATSAEGVSYDNTTSGLAADNVQDAIDETVVIAEDAQADIDAHIADTTGAHAASALSVVPVGTISSTTVQGAINELQGDTTALTVRVAIAESDIDQLQIDVVAAQNAADNAQSDIDSHIADTVGAHAASAISNIPAGAISSTDVQSAINELDSAVTDAQADATQALSDAASAQADIDAHIADTVDAHDASAISNVPAGSIVSTDVQGAIDEISSRIDNLTTTDVPEGDNLYFTDERAQDAVGSIISSTDSITLTYDDDTPFIYADVVTQQSVTFDPAGVKLVNDEETPGSSKYYGT